MKKNLRDRFLNIIAFVLLFLLVASIIFKVVDFIIISRGEVKVEPVDNAKINSRLLDPIVQVGNAVFHVEIADDPEERYQGLSGRNKIEDYQGMLFVFNWADYYQFWMKDMRFDLDLIYIYNDEVVDIVKDVSSDPKMQSILYTPKKKANIVLEVLAGSANKYKIEVGSKVVYRNMKVIKP